MFSEISLSQRHTSLTEHLVAFSRYLRNHRYKIGSEEITLGLESIALIPFSDRNVFILMLQICFARSEKQWFEIKDLYKSFLQEHKKAVDAKKKPVPEISGKKTDQENSYQITDIRDWLKEVKEPFLQTSFHSPFASHEVTDLRNSAMEEAYWVTYWMKLMLRKIAGNRQRKKRKNKIRGIPDLRSLQRSRFSKGDELLDLSFRSPLKNRVKVVFLIDVSRSMSMFNQFTMHLAEAIKKNAHRNSIYLFNTGIFEVKRFSDWEKIPGMWHGGTRIGVSLDEWLNQKPSWVDMKTLILIFSDGWDTGDLDLLSDTLERIRRLSPLILWFNPVLPPDFLSNDALIPVSGMKTAFPFLWHLASVRNVETLRSLVQERW